MTPSTFSGSFKRHLILQWINTPVQESCVSVTSFCQVYQNPLGFIKEASSKPEQFFGKYFELVIGSGQISSMIFKLFHPGNLCGYLISAVRSGLWVYSVQLGDNCCMSACRSRLLQVSFTLLST